MQRINVFVQGESGEFWAHVRLLYSFVVLGLFTLLPMILATELRSAGWHEHALGVILFFGFGKLWTWTRAAAAMLAIISYFACRDIRLHHESGLVGYARSWIELLQGAKYLRNILAVFTFGVTLWLIATQLVEWRMVFAAMGTMQFLP